MANYKTRRGLVPAEALLGYLAFIVGLAGSGLVAQGSRLAETLQVNGDSIIWAVVFMSVGTAMSIAAMVDGYARTTHNEMLVRWLARLRIELHVLLFGAWCYGMATVMSFQKWPVIFLLLAPVFAAYHLWGAWEHTKARYLSAESKYHGLYDRVSRGGFGGR